jgi:hypothetical protein
MLSRKAGLHFEMFSLHVSIRRLIHFLNVRMLTGISLRMPKNNQKGKRREATATSDDDFDDMLAELRAADLTALAANTSSSSSNSSSSSSSSSASTTANSITNTIVASTASSTAKAIEVPEERIIEAIRRDDIAQLRRWARQGFRATSAVSLLYAASLGKVGIAQCLVQELGVGVNQADEGGYTPLFVAALEGHLAMVRCLVKELGADVNTTSHAGYTPMYQAAGKGNFAMVRCLATECGADVNQADRKGITPLYIAAQKGKMAVVQCLVKELDADVNQSNRPLKETRRWELPLFMAISNWYDAWFWSFTQKSTNIVKRVQRHCSSQPKTATSNWCGSWSKNLARTLTKQD